jgi:hypothetical protein
MIKSDAMKEAFRVPEEQTVVQYGTSEPTSFSRDFDDSGLVLIPNLWLSEMFSQNNLFLTVEHNDLAMSGKPSHNVLFEILSKISIGKDDRSVAYYQYNVETRRTVVIRSTKDQGYNRATPPILRIVRKGKVIGKIYESGYYFWNPNQKYDQDGKVEFLYNKDMFDYFRSSCPIGIKSFTPLHPNFNPMSDIPVQKSIDSKRYLKK